MVWTESEERKEKQNYLRTEIIDSGYDSDKFIDYLKIKRNKGENIDNWSFYE